MQCFTTAFNVCAIFRTGLHLPSPLLCMHGGPPPPVWSIARSDQIHYLDVSAEDVLTVSRITSQLPWPRMIAVYWAGKFAVLLTRYWSWAPEPWAKISIKAVNKTTWMHWLWHFSDISRVWVLSFGRFDTWAKHSWWAGQTSPYRLSRSPLHQAAHRYGAPEHRNHRWSGRIRF